SLPSLAQGSPTTVFPVLLDRLRGTPRPRSTSAVRAQAAQAFACMGKAAAQRPEVPLALVAALHDTDPDVRSEVTEALEKIGAAAARFPEVLSALVAVLHNGDQERRAKARVVLGAMGEAASRHVEVPLTLVAGLREFGWPYFYREMWE